MDTTAHIATAAIATADLTVLAIRGAEYVDAETFARAETLLGQVCEAQRVIHDDIDFDDVTDAEFEQIDGYRLAADRAFQTIARARVRILDEQAAPAL